MANGPNKTQVPTPLKRLVDTYLNTSLFMGKLWFRTILAAAVLLPLGFHLKGDDLILVLVESVGLWLCLAITLRFVVFQFRHTRADRVARRIDRHIPPEHPARQEVIRWIYRKEGSGYRDTLLEKLGAISPPAKVAPEPAPQPADTGHRETTVTHGSYSYSTSGTRVWIDGVWVPADKTEREEADQAPPLDFEPIPIPAPPERGENETRDAGLRRRDKPEYMPLEPDDFEPDMNDDGGSSR